MPEREVQAAAHSIIEAKLRRYLVPKPADRLLVSRVAMRSRLWDIGIMARPPETTMPHRRRQEARA